MMPLAVCKLGSGALAVTVMGTAAGAVAGLFWVLERQEKAAQALIEAQIQAGTYVHTPSPPPPHWVGPLFAIVGCVILVSIWWAMRQSFYAHCLRYWHPEIAPPRKVPCPNCDKCKVCGGSRRVDECAAVSVEAPA